MDRDHARNYVLRHELESRRWWLKAMHTNCNPKTKLSLIQKLVQYLEPSLQPLHTGTKLKEALAHAWGCHKKSVENYRLPEKPRGGQKQIHEENKMLRSLLETERSAKQEEATGLRPGDQLFIEIPPPEGNQEFMWFVDAFGKFLGDPENQEKMLSWRDKEGLVEIQGSRLELFLLHDDFVLKASQLETLELRADNLTDGSTMVCDCFIESNYNLISGQQRKFNTPVEVCKTILKLIITQMQQEQELSDRYEFSTFSLICQFGKSEAQIPHLDATTPNRLCLTYFSDNVAPTVVLKRKEDVPAITEPKDLENIWQDLVPEHCKPHVVGIIKTLNDYTFQSQICHDLLK